MGEEMSVFLIIVGVIAAGVIYVKYFKKEPEDVEEIDPAEPIEMRFKKGDVIIHDGIERLIVEVHNGYYIWEYLDQLGQEFDSRNSNDPELLQWEISIPEEPEEENGTIELFTESKTFDGTLFDEIPHKEELSLVDENGDVPFTLILLIKAGEVKHSTIVGKFEPGKIEWVASLKDYGAELSLHGKNSSITAYLPIDKIDFTKDNFIAFTYNGSKLREGIKGNLNGRMVALEILGNGEYGGMVSTDASVTVGGNKFGDKFNYVGEIAVILDKGKQWSAVELEEKYKQIFNIESIYLEPDADGIFRFPFGPNTGIDITEEANEWWQNIPSGTPDNKVKIYIKPGFYWIERSALMGRDDRGCFDWYGKKHWYVYSPDKENPAVFFTKAPATPYVNTEGRKGVSKRSTIKKRYCKDITLQNINIEGSNRIDAYLLGSSPQYTPEWLPESEKREFEGRLRGSGPYKSHLAFEHGHDDAECEDIKYIDCKVFGVWGDGFYGASTINYTLLNCVTDMIARMGAGFADGMKNILIDGLDCFRGSRADIDFEGDTGGDLEDIEIVNSKIRTHISAAGYGRVNNVYIHDSGIGTIFARGVKSLRRKNWRIEDNYRIGGHGSSMADIQVYETEDISIKRNQLNISDVQGRWAIDVYRCSGKIEIEDNDFTQPSKITLREVYKNSKISVKRNTPEGIIELKDDFWNKRQHLDKIQEPVQITYND